jgi:hypothetical protein
MRRRLARIGLKILLGLTIGFGVLEVALRILPIAIPTRVLQYLEPEIRVRAAKGRFATSSEMVPVERDDGGPVLRVWKPHAKVRYPWLDDYGAVRELEMDAQGFANPPGRYGDRIDILAIGDSFTFAHAIQPKDAWAIRLGDRLGRTSYNLGLAGNGLYEYLQFLKRFGLSREPKVVVLNVYEGNDLRDAVAFHRAVAGHGNMDELPPEPWHGSFLARHSYAYNFVRGTISYLSDRSEQRDAEEAIDFRFQIGPVPMNQGQGARDEPAFAIWQQEGRYPFSLFDRALEDFAALAKEHGFLPVVTYSPWAFRPYDDVEFRDPALRAKLDAFSREQRAYFERKSAELGMAFLDLEPALHAAAGQPTKQNLLYYPTTIHYTARAHAVVAEAIAVLLEKALEDGKPADR